MLLRRTLAAMGITIGVFLAVRVPVEMSIWSMTSVRTGLRHRLGHANGGGTAQAGLPGGGSDELRAGLRLTDLRFRGSRLTDPGSSQERSPAPMAQRTQIVFADDIDGSEAEATVRFAVGGTQYEIDLNAAHAEEFRQAVRPYVDAARKAGRGPSRRSGRSSPHAAGPESSEVRVWARAQGLKVSARGRVPDELIVRFRAAGQ